MATLANNKRNFLLGQGIANGDLARMEKTYYQGLSGLSNPESYSLVDHKRAFFKAFLGLSDNAAGALSISDLERQYLGAPVGDPLSTAWDKFYNLVNVIKSPGTPYAWFDARFPVGFNAVLPADNAALSQWNDISGNGYHAAQGTGGQQPKFKRTAGLGVGKCIQFDGVDDQLVFNSPAISATPFTVYAVFQVLSAGVTKSIYGGNPANNNGTSIFATNGPAPYIRLWAGPAGSAGESQTLTQTTPVVFTGAWGTTSAIAYVNGIQGTTIVETVGVAGTTSYIGSENANFSNANIYALVIYNQAHTAAQRQSIERALGAVFGISVA